MIELYTYFIVDFYKYYFVTSPIINVKKTVNNDNKTSSDRYFRLQGKKKSRVPDESSNT